MTADRGVERGLWYGVLTAPAAWTAHLLLAYALVSLRCGKGLPVSPLAVHGLTAVAALLAASALLVAVRLSRTLPEGTGATAHRRRWMAATGTIVSALYLLGILLGDIPPALLPPC